MSLYLGMEIPNWPPDNIAELSKNLRKIIINETRFRIQKIKQDKRTWKALFKNMLNP